MNFSTWPWQWWGSQRSRCIALRLTEETLDWQTLCQRVDALAGGFYQQGLREGDGVVLRGRNSPQALLCWLALMQCGARILPINPQLPADQLCELLPGLSVQYLIELGTPLPMPGMLRLKISASRPHTLDWQPQRLVSMTLTSGSTGLPKAAVHCAAAHLASAAGLLGVMNYTKQDCWLLSLPLFHVSGQGILWRWLLMGARLAIGPLDDLQGCSHVSLVPTQLSKLLATSAPLRLKEVLLGGAEIPYALIKRAQSRGLRCWCGYGLTELASTVCVKPADGKPDAGQVLPGREIKIVDQELWVRGTSLASGYWQHGKLTALVNQQGWFATRDRGTLHNGRLTLHGRLDNLFFSAGEGIQPEQIERVLLRHPQVLQAFILPVDDPEFGKRPVALVEMQDKRDIAQLAGWAQQKLARFQQPVRWLPLPDSISSGGIKISRAALTQWLAENQ